MAGRTLRSAPRTGAATANLAGFWETTSVVDGQAMIRSADEPPS
ncbi:MAG: hypothetical protein AVDCRST_MAG73-1067 [uncultured Thermomicrobiales bacterium]|uniref:Uncharacterized protein n=1 Tax=uncultured Thermomicrobiales bacterium TaxID=1645740 RepID=A0A6J4TVQ0_9BACT|nr:MAG: hypothetical protein AVDCRST_MAG73-1067 [uncultured Thermomicrobiales bacterium]